MSKLEYYSRPLVAFDPSNKQHRRWYYQFVETRSWGHCPVRFIVPDANGMDLVRMITNELLRYYVEQEFKGEKPSKVKGHRKTLGLTSGGFGIKIES